VLAGARVALAEAADEAAEAARERAPRAQHLAAEQVERLDAVRALVDHRDARVAEELLDAGLAHIAVPAVDLDRLARAFERHARDEALDDRRQHREQRGRVIFRLGVGMVQRSVHLLSGVPDEDARTLDERLLSQQHAAHVGMADDRIGGALRRPRYVPAALARVGDRGLPAALALGEALQADPEARVVHHREHVPEAAVDLADQPAARAVEVHHAGRRAVDAELVLDARTADAVGLDRAHLPRRQELRDEEHADAARPCGRVGSFASTRCTMFSVRSCSPLVMKILVPVTR
jgi:hypothetical protein